MLYSLYHFSQFTLATFSPTCPLLSSPHTASRNGPTIPVYNFIAHKLTSRRLPHWLALFARNERERAARRGTEAEVQRREQQHREEKKEEDEREQREWHRRQTHH